VKHLKKGRKFGRKSGPRKALMKSLASSFFMLGNIKTTEAKAKELRPLVEKMITKGKNPSLATRKILRQSLNPEVIKKIFEIAEKNKNRAGGYTRITKLDNRPRDSAKMAIIEMVK